MTPHQFNLLTDPWIPVIGFDGTCHELGIRDTILQASALRAVSAETPQMTTALYRLLLAALHDCLQGPNGVHELVHLWNRTLSAEHWHAWCDAHADRFELFDAERPFYQVPALTDGAQPKTVAVLMPHIPSGNAAPVQHYYRDDAPPTLTPAQAARWLVHAHAYDSGGLKTPYRGKGKAGNRRGPLSSFTHVRVESPAGLADTLRLNLVLVAGPMGSAPWMEEPRPPERVEDRPVAGRLDMLTWQSRRILLLPEDDGAGATVVRRCIRTGGDQFPDGDLCDWAEHEAGCVVALSRKNAPFPAPWRESVQRMLPVLLAPVGASEEEGEPPVDLSPPVIQQTAWVLASGLIPPDNLIAQRVRLVLTGYEMDKYGTVYVDARHSTLTLPSAVMADRWQFGRKSKPRRRSAKTAPRTTDQS